MDRTDLIRGMLNLTSFQSSSSSSVFTHSSSSCSADPYPPPNRKLPPLPIDMESSSVSPPSSEEQIPATCGSWIRSRRRASRLDRQTSTAFQQVLGESFGRLVKDIEPARGGLELALERDLLDLRKLPCQGYEEFVPLSLREVGVLDVDFLQCLLMTEQQ